jgi:hypothetical protein
MFQLNASEFADWRSQVVMSNPGAKMGLRRPPFAFTEHGALMAATVLNSPRAVEMSLYVVRAFAQLREVLATHKDLATKLATLERQMQSLALKHDTLAQNTRAQLKQSNTRGQSQIVFHCNHSFADNVTIAHLATPRVRVKLFFITFIPSLSQSRLQI